MILKFSPDGTHLAAATPNNGTVVWDIIKKSVLLQTSAYTALNFSACGMLLATGAENTITLWQERSKKWESTIEQDSRITWIDFYDPTTLLVGFSDGTLLLFDTNSQKVICESRVHKQAVLFAIRNPAMEIVSVGKDKRIVLTQIIYPEYAKPYLQFRHRRKIAKEMTAHIVGKARNSAVVLANKYGGVEYRLSDLRHRKADTLFMGKWSSVPVATAEVFRAPEYLPVTALNVSYNSSKEEIYLGFQNGAISIGKIHHRKRLIFTQQRLKAEIMTADPMEGAVAAIAGSARTDLMAAATDRQVTLYDLTTLERIGSLPDV